MVQPPSLREPDVNDTSPNKDSPDLPGRQHVPDANDRHDTEVALPAIAPAATVVDADREYTGTDEIRRGLATTPASSPIRAPSSVPKPVLPTDGWSSTTSNATSPAASLTCDTDSCSTGTAFPSSSSTP